VFWGVFPPFSFFPHQCLEVTVLLLVFQFRFFLCSSSSIQIRYWFFLSSWLVAALQVFTVVVSDCLLPHEQVLWLQSDRWMQVLEVPFSLGPPPRDRQGLVCSVSVLFYGTFFIESPFFFLQRVQPIAPFLICIFPPQISVVLEFWRVFF